VQGTKSTRVPVLAKRCGTKGARVPVSVKKGWH
jgi:hypothetical protein